MRALLDRNLPLLTSGASIMKLALRSLLARGLFCAGILAPLGCGDQPSPTDPVAPSTQRAERTVLVTIDTLRDDRVGSTSHGQPVTPRLDALAARGARFRNAIAPVPITLPSHTTIMTGLQPTRHGVRANSTFALAPEIPTLASRARAAGIPTGAFVGAVVLGSAHGLDQGFDIYDDRMGSRVALGRSGGYPERQANEVVDAALGWLTVEQPERFFLWVHVYDPHMAHEPPTRFSDLFPDDLYAAEINFTDQEIGRLIDGVEAQYPDDQTLFIVTSDHGESLGEHNDPTHSYTIYDATQKVPFILVGPRVPSHREVEAVIPLADTAPTVLAAMELAPFSETDGRDLHAYLDDEPDPPRAAWVETVATHLEYGWSPMYGLRTERFKYIRAPRPELYLIPSDPGERSNLITQLPGVAEDFDAQVSEVLAAARPIRMVLDPDPAERAKLIALGYIIPDNNLDLEAAVVVGGIDPKDVVQSLMAVATAMDHHKKGENELALEVLASLDDGAHVNVPRARVARTLGRFDEALGYAQRAAAESPSWSDAQLELATCLRAVGRTEEALAAFEFVTQLDPHNPSAHLSLGTMWMLEGDLEKAAAHLEEAVNGNALVEEAYWRLAAVRLGQGRRDDADALLDALPRRERFDPIVVRNLAAGEVLAGDVKAARKRVRLTLRRHPNADGLRAYGEELARLEETTASD
jgi:arylsulfatase A-like enzyme/Flp pilus assembly protein TadD